MKAPLARWTGVDVAAAAYALVYCSWLLARAAGLAVPDIGGIVFDPLGLIVAWANWQNARAAGIDERTRTGWLLLAGAAIVLWVSGSVWTILLDTVGDAGRLSPWLDRAALGQDVLAIAGYLCFPRRKVPRSSVARLRLDAALVIVAGFVSAVYFSLRLLVRDPAESVMLAVIESSTDWALFAVAGIGFLDKRDAEIRRAMLLLLAANLAYIFANAIYAVLPDYRAGHQVDVLWFLAWALRYVAARQARTRPAETGEARPADLSGRGYRSSRLSYVMVGGAIVLMLSRVLTGDDPFLEALAVAAMLMGALLVLRQFAEIEENRRLFEAQLERESRFQAVVQNSSDVVVVVDPGGTITYVSPSARRVFGGRSPFAVGESFWNLRPQEGSQELEALLAGTAQAAPQLETRIETSPGTWRDLELAWTDLRRDASVRGFVVNCRDVTERREYERYVRHAQELDAVGHLAGGLAHDLNNLLTVIRGYAELLQSDWPEDSPLRADLDEVIAAVDRAGSVTARILAFSRKQPVRRKRLDLNAVIDDVRPILGHVTRDSVEIRLSLDPKLWPVTADQVQMEQVLVNLVSNAGDAMPGGGDIRIATTNRTIGAAAPEAGDLAPGDYVAMAVSDRGAGIRPEIRARIFEPFFTTKPPGRGFGLGLAVVRSIVGDMDGHVAVDSREGGGSTFTVLLPRAEVG